MPVQHILLAIFITAIWGVNYIFIKLGVHEIPPLFLCAVRFFLASVPAIFFVRFPKNAIKAVILYGLIMFALQFSLVFLSLSAGMAAGMASILLQTSVFFSILFAAIFIKEIPTFWQIAGALLSFTGVIVTARHLNANMTLAGFIFALAAAVASGLGNLITRKLGYINTPTLVSWGCFVAFPPLLLLSFLLEGTDQISYAIHHVTWVGISSLLYIVYLSTWVGYGTWSWLLGRYPVSTVVPFSLLIPVFATLSSMLFLNEHFEPWKINVAGLIIAGLCVNLFIPRLLKLKNAKEKLSLAEQSAAESL